jgi:hypothetical protein
MRVTDYPRSFMRFTAPGATNIARIEIVSRCTIFGGPGAGDFSLVAPCRSEHMYLESGLFQDPNYDFRGVWSNDEYLILRTHAGSDLTRASEWDAGTNAERFADVTIDLPDIDARPLEDAAAVMRATVDENAPIVARTFFRDRATGNSAMAEYPVRTMNVARDGNGAPRFQVDAGPAIVPAWIGPANVPWRKDRPIERIDMAYLCWNRFGGHTELALREPVEIGRTESGPVRAWHYGRIAAVEARHELFAVTG